MSLLLGETFSGLKIQRPVQWVLRTQNPLLFKYKAMRYLKSVPPRLAIAPRGGGGVLPYVGYIATCRDVLGP